MSQENNRQTNTGASNTRGSNCEDGLEDEDGGLPPSIIFNVGDIVKSLFHEIIRLLPHLSKSEAKIVIDMLYTVESLPQKDRLDEIERVYSAITEILTEVDRDPHEFFAFTADTVSELCFIFNSACSLEEQDCNYLEKESCTLNNISILTGIDENDSYSHQNSNHNPKKERISKYKRLGIFLTNRLKAKA